MEKVAVVTDVRGGDLFRGLAVPPSTSSKEKHGRLK